MCNESAYSEIVWSQEGKWEGTGYVQGLWMDRKIFLTDAQVNLFFLNVVLC